MNQHWKRDLEKLLLHRRIAARLRVDPEKVLRTASANLNRWLADDPQSKPYFQEWRSLLDVLSVDELDQLIASPDEEGVRLRQSSPFAGVLDGQERQDALDEASRIWTSLTIKADRDGEFSSAAEFLQSVIGER